MITQSISKLVPIITNSESHAPMRLKKLHKKLQDMLQFDLLILNINRIRRSTSNTLHIHTNANHYTILDEFTLFWAKKPAYFSLLNNSSSIYVISNLNFIKDYR